MIADMFNNKKLKLVVTELFIRGRKLNFSCFYYAIPLCSYKKIRLNSTHYFIMKILSEQYLQKIAFNHLSDNDLKGFMNLHKRCTVKPNSFLVIDATLA